VVSAIKLLEPFPFVWLIEPSSKPHPNSNRINTPKKIPQKQPKNRLSSLQSTYPIPFQQHPNGKKPIPNRYNVK
jgi:hypothetical protein